MRQREFHNTNWAFPVSVTAYTDRGVTLVPAGTVVVMAKNGVLQTSTGTNVSGVAVFKTVDVQPGNVLTFWLSGASVKGATADVTDAVAVSFDLYGNHLIARNDGAANITDANLATSASPQDSDLASVFHASGTTLALQTGKTLYVPSSSALAPGGAVSAGDVRVLGTLAMAGNPATILGSLNASGGTVTTSGTLTFSGTGSSTLTTGGSTLSNVVVSKSGATLAFADNLATAGNLTISSGTLDARGRIPHGFGNLRERRNAPSQRK